MKCRWVLLPVLLLGCPGFARAANGDGSARMDRHTTELTVKLLLDELQRQWAAQPLSAAEVMPWQTPVTPALTDPAAARKEVEARYVEHLRQSYAGRVQALWAELLAAHGDPQILTQAYREEAEKLPMPVIAENLKNIFPAPYTEARAALVSEQRQNLTAVIYPSVQEVESSTDDALLPLLQKRLVAAAAQPVLAENLAFLENDRIRPVLAEARRQRAMQLEWVKNVDLTPVYDAGKAQELLRENAAALLAAKRLAEPKLHWYDLFPGVDQAIVRRSENLFWDKIRAALPAHLPAGSDERLATRILATPAEFKEPEAMQKTLQFEYFDNAMSDSVHQVMNAAAGADAAFNQWAESGWKGVPADINRTLLAAFTANIVPHLPPARKLAAERQFAGLFPDLADDSWLAPMAAVEARQKPEQDFPFYCADRTPAPDLAVCLPETVELAAAASRRRFEAGQQALQQERQLLDTIYSQLEQELKTASEQRDAMQSVTLLSDDTITGMDLTRLPQPAELTKTYTERMEREWRKVDSPYAELFPAVRAEIAIRVKALLASRRREELSKPPAPVPLKEEMSLDFLITISRPGESIQVDLAQSGSSVEERLTCPMQPGSYRQQEPEVLHRTSRWIAERILAAQAKSGNAPVKLNIQIQVKDGWIYYQFVARMLVELKEAFREHKIKVEDALL